MKTPRIVVLMLLVLALSLGIVMSQPPKAEAFACCGWEYTWTYYFDAAKTQWAGEIYSNDCDGTSYSSGQVTAYKNLSKICCDPC